MPPKRMGLGVAEADLGRILGKSNAKSQSESCSRQSSALAGPNRVFLGGITSCRTKPSARQYDSIWSTSSKVRRGLLRNGGFTLLIVVRLLASVNTSVALVQRASASTFKCANN